MSKMMKEREFVCKTSLSLIAVGVLVASWLWFMPRIFIHYAPRICTLLGFSAECIPAVPSTVSWAHRAHYTLFFILFAIGLFTLKNVKWSSPMQSLMTINLGVYAITTACFAAFRAGLGLGRPLLVGAALHNVGEWIIVSQLFGKDAKEVKKYLKYSFAWTSLICVLIIISPRLLYAIVLEQAVGIMLDYGLVFVFAFLSVWGSPYKQGSAQLFTRALASVGIHIFFTILPLVWGNLSVGVTGTFFVFNEISIFVSAITTHVLYIKFAWEYDEQVNMARFDPNAKEISTSQDVLLKGAGAPEKSKKKKDSDLKGNNSTTGDEPNTSEESFESKLACLKKLTFGWPLTWFSCIIAGMIIGVISVVIVPLSFPQVYAHDLPSPVPRSSFIVGTAVAKIKPELSSVFLNQISAAKLAYHARMAEGNIDYRIFHNINNPDEVRFIETWRSKEALFAWMKSPVVQEVFHKNPIVQHILEGGKLADLAGYNEVLGNSEEAPFVPPPVPPADTVATQGGVRFTVKSECKKVWKVVSDPHDCSWIIGCRRVEVDKNDTNRRTLYFDQGKSRVLVFADINPEKMSFSDITVDAGYSSYVRLHDIPPSSEEAQHGDQCAITYRYESKGLTNTVMGVFQDFQNVRIPALKEKFKG